MDSDRFRYRLLPTVTAGLALLLTLQGAGLCAPATVGPDPGADAATAKEEVESGGAGRRPDILLILMDDVGIDQMTAFGWGGVDPASTPNINRLAAAGVKFSNAWSMPECSPARATIFTGRWPLRTGVQSALVENMLPQDEVSPYEVTLPRVLRHTGYVSAMVGKYHMGNFNNPSGNCSPSTRGWDYFSGNLGADPPSIDMQAGLTSTRTPTPTPLPCGFDQSPNPGACYFIDGSCNQEQNGKMCLEAGGIFVAQTACQNPVP